MNRREFMVAASGVAGGAAAVTAARPVAAQDEDDSGDGGGGDEEDGGGEDGGEEEDGGEGGGGGETVEVTVGPGGDPEFDPDGLEIPPGTTVHWTWDSDNHNIQPTGQPDEADWEGHPDIVDEGEEYEFTFEVEGEYEYICEPHVGQGMEGSVTVDPDAEAGGGGAGEAEVEVHDLGVPIQAHYVGIATILAIFVSLVFTFYLLKYGESAHSSSPGRR